MKYSAYLNTTMGVPEPVLMLVSGHAWLILLLFVADFSLVLS